jgi:hypothetical protein
LGGELKLFRSFDNFKSPLAYHNSIQKKFFMKNLKKIQIICLLLLNFSVFAQKNNDSTQTKRGHLFKKDEMLELKLTTNFKPLMKDRALAKPPYHWAKLEYDTKKKGTVTLKIRIKVRGNFRKSPANCAFPPLLLNIPNKKDKNTIFEHQNLLKLITHCRNEDYVFQEYLVYKVYNTLSDYSFKARLAKVTYQDSAGKRETETRYAFLLEDEHFLANRNKTKNINLKQLPNSGIDSVNMAMVSVFEYMIGNTDWSVPFLHNIKLMGKPNGMPHAVPYDFDHSGIVEAKYARPAEILDIHSVRQRLYRGITYSPAVFKEVFDTFKNKKSEIYAIYQQNSQLKADYIERTIKYLDDFYKIIDDPKSLKNVFVLGGGKATTGNVIIKGLN